MDKINDALTRGVVDILPDKNNLANLMREKKITLYQGFDPSMPSLHLGNLVGLMKLRQFQKLGHKIIFLVGDFTGMIGDPSDKPVSRKQLSKNDVSENSKSWRVQAGKILDFNGKNKAQILFNSSWNNKITFENLIKISSKFTVQQLLARDMFQNRIKNNIPIYLHEFLYPVAQAIDSVEMDVDLEIGGNDQLFNMLAGRILMKAVKNKEKYVLTLKLLVDKEGNKVGKTTGNALFLDTPANEFYSGIMSLPDEVIKLGFELLTEIDLQYITEKIQRDPMQEKKHLAYEVTKLIHGEKQAKSAEKYFESTFQEKKPDFKTLVKSGNNLLNTITPYLKSKSEAKRYIASGSVDVNGNVSTNPTLIIKSGDKIKLGQKIFIKANDN